MEYILFWKNKYDTHKQIKTNIHAQINIHVTSSHTQFTSSTHICIYAHSMNMCLTPHTNKMTHMKTSRTLQQNPYALYTFVSMFPHRQISYKLTKKWLYKHEGMWTHLSHFHLSLSAKSSIPSSLLQVPYGPPHILDTLLIGLTQALFS